MFKRLPAFGIYIRVRRILAVFFVGWLCLLTGSANAAHTRATLLLSASTVRPGDTVVAGVRLQMDAGWHTYWKNPGASGKATEIHWQLPAGLTAGDIQWPPPEKYVPLTGEPGDPPARRKPDPELTTYVYHDEVVLLVPLQVAADLPPGERELKAKVSWLECETLCVPGSANVAARLEIGDVTKPSPDAAVLAAWQGKLPQPAVGLNARAVWETSGGADKRSLLLEWDAPTSVTEADFFPHAADAFEIQSPVERLPAGPGTVRLRKMVKKYEGDWPAEVSGVLVQKVGGELQHFAVEFSVASLEGSELPVAGAQGGGAGPAANSLWLMLVYAFVGGMILNVMPCVFPVIALKILGFVQQTRESPRRVFQLGLVYAAGVVASFVLLAAVVIGVQWAGGAASWGMQLQNPYFSVALTVLITLVALNLFGIFEVNLGGRALAGAGQLAARPGAGGAFFTGVLATALATPCTAPFLAPALGFAFTQPPARVALFFVTVALGLAFPYVVLSWRPTWLKLLPRPGAWMERFKVAMGFPMLAVAVWLFSFTARRFGPEGPLWLGLFLVIVALAAWIWGEFVQRGSRRRGWAMAVSLALVAAGYTVALEHELHWRAPLAESPKPVPASGQPGPVPAGGRVVWTKWDADAFARIRAERRPLLVDFTADWCLTCKWNERNAINVPEVRARLEQLNGLTLIVDNTDEDPSIVAELKRFQRAGVPLVLVYPADEGRPPMVLPTLLTKRAVLDALQQVAN